ncbi:hypothetical protein FHX74_001036 [Friedmanniella endophytica]|uniref:Peptidoglycan binding domain-containing protein n=1 Tax=Microlunatus kandeliicorticis TaxID=1759536 RepID=A0A7W3IQL0_9ACTN|nr:peptidoglycan-binding domain-containing protein [Microlunatus kandeliicorticis]MBA8793431.1 hypothetical protein [Microlunatus kandeliicorticis]
MPLAPRALLLRLTALVAAVVVGLAVLVLGTGGGVTADAATTVRKPSAPQNLPEAIEPMARYVPDTSCDPKGKPGAVKLGQLLTTTYPNTTFLRGRTCGSSPDSEHYDGRAVDWMNSIRNKTQAAQAKAVISWLFAKDADGNTYANARRLGVMYVIWDGKIWGAYSADRGWRTYAGCDKLTAKSYDTMCHRDHMHISLSWEGAMGRTSFWTGKVAATDYGPCRASGMVWAAPYKKARTTPCPQYPTPRAPKGASATYKSLLAVSGQTLVGGRTGSAVTAVQRALKVPTTGRFDTTTQNAVRTWQSGHGLNRTGAVGLATWRTLLAGFAPK